jgi:hypothetical protein
MTSQTLIDPDALPYAKTARLITAVYKALAGIGRFVRTIDQARTAAQVSRDLYSLPASSLAARGLTRADVPNYVLRKLGVFSTKQRAANDDTKIAA